MGINAITAEQLQPRTDLAVKLLAYALDPAAGEGEALNAADKFIRACRREGVCIESLAEALSQHVDLDHQAQLEPEPSACEITMPCGRYDGTSLGEIARIDIGYLEWVSENFRQLAVRQAAQVALEWFTREVAA